MVLPLRTTKEYNGDLKSFFLKHDAKSYSRNIYKELTDEYLLIVFGYDFRAAGLTATLLQIRLYYNYYTVDGIYKQTAIKDYYLERRSLLCN